MTDVAGVLLFPGAGSSSTHSSLVAIETALAPLPVARVDFPYRRAGKSFPDKTPVLVECVREETATFAAQLGVDSSHIVIGGRSMGGRMCSIAIAEGLKVAGLVLISYPLHPPKKPENLRTAHLGELNTPMLCISGTRDNFGSPEELTDAFRIAPGDVEWRWIENGRHELKGADDVVAGHVAQWVGARSATRR